MRFHHKKTDPKASAFVCVRRFLVLMDARLKLNYCRNGMQNESHWDGLSGVSISMTVSGQETG